LTEKKPAFVAIAIITGTLGILSKATTFLAFAFLGAIDGVVRDRDTELRMQLHDQIARPPTHHTVPRRIGPSFTSRERKTLCSSLSLGGAPGEGMLVRPSGPCSLNRITRNWA
jgi:hypothetical protein